MVCIGIFLILCDSLTFDREQNVPRAAFGYRHVWYLLPNRTVFSRLIWGDIPALLLGYILSKFSSNNSGIREKYPPFLVIMCNSIGVAFNMALGSYFFSATDLCCDIVWGWLGLFHHRAFSAFIYMAIIFTLGSFLQSFLISKIFEPIIPATAALFEPIFNILFLHAGGTQHYPGI
jgi:hypothetical protein